MTVLRSSYQKVGKGGRGQDSIWAVGGQSLHSQACTYTDTNTHTLKFYKKKKKETVPGCRAQPEAAQANSI